MLSAAAITVSELFPIITERINELSFASFTDRLSMPAWGTAVCKHQPDSSMGLITERIGSSTHDAENPNERAERATAAHEFYSAKRFHKWSVITTSFAMLLPTSSPRSNGCASCRNY